MRIGVIGTGAIAARHLSALAAVGTPQVVAHLATSLDKADAAAARSGGAGFCLPRRFHAAGRPDAVVVCVPPDRHGVIEDRLIDDRIPVPRREAARSRVPIRLADCRTGLASRSTSSRRSATTGAPSTTFSRARSARRPSDPHDRRRIPCRYACRAWWRRRQARSGGQFRRTGLPPRRPRSGAGGRGGCVAACPERLRRAALSRRRHRRPGVALLRYRVDAVGASPRRRFCRRRPPSACVSFARG